MLFLLGINLLVMLAGAVLSKGAFIDPYNLQSMAGQLPELGLLAIGVMLAMRRALRRLCTGEICSLRPTTYGLSGLMAGIAAVLIASRNVNV